ncbi:unnamed protein product, partial [marine sediment metagenome]
MPQINLRVKVEGAKKGCVGFYKEEYRKRTNDSQEVLFLELLEISKRFKTITRIEFMAEESQEIKPFDPRKSVKLQEIWNELID